MPHDLGAVCLLLAKLMMCAKTNISHAMRRSDTQHHSQNNPEEQATHLQVIFPVDNESVAEHVPHDDQVRVLALHRNPVHAQKLREECTAMTLHYMLRDTTQKESYSVSFNHKV